MQCNCFLLCVLFPLPLIPPLGVLYYRSDICFACEERLDFCRKWCYISALQTAACVLISIGSQLVCFMGMRESNAHLFVRARSVLPVGSQFTQAANRAHGAPCYHSFDSKVPRFSVAGWVASSKVLSPTFFHKKKLLCLTSTFCHDQQGLVPTAKEINSSRQWNRVKETWTCKEKRWKDGLSHLHWPWVSQKLSKLLWHSKQNHLEVFCTSCKQDFSLRCKHL